MNTILHMQKQSRYSWCFAQDGATFHILQHSVSYHKSELIISLPVSLPQYKAAPEMSIVMRVRRVGPWKLCSNKCWRFSCCVQFETGTVVERGREEGQEPDLRSIIPAEANSSISNFHQSRGWITAVHVLWCCCKKNIVCLPHSPFSNFQNIWMLFFPLDNLTFLP